MKIKGETILILGGLAVGAYLLYKMFGGAAKTISDVVGGVGTVVDAGAQIMQKPVVPPTPEIGIKSPTVIDYVFPPAGIPKFIENFVTDSTGQPNVMTAPVKAALTVGLATGALKPTPKKETPIIKRVSPIGAYYTPVIGGSIAHNVLVPTKPGQTPSRPSETSLHGKKSAFGFTIGGR